MGRVSGNGWAVGTAGGVLALLLILPLIVIFDEGTLMVRLSLVITAVFFALAAIPLFLWLPERARRQALPPGENYLSLAFKRLARTIRTAGNFREFVKFMVAFLVYNDGIIMALDFAAIIGAVLFGMEQQDLIIFVIIVQLTNVVGAYVFGRWVDRYGGKRSLIIAILMMIGVVTWMYFNQSQLGFYLIGAVAGFAMAGAQSVSRTMVAMFSPPGQAAEFYGFFAVAGRTSSFIGPTVYGFVAAEAALWYERQGQVATLAEQSGQRLAILSMIAFFLVGLLLLLLVNEAKARRAVGQSAPPDLQVAH
jgi:UMF1 family MFS transporter